MITRMVLLLAISTLVPIQERAPEEPEIERTTSAILVEAHEAWDAEQWRRAGRLFGIARERTASRPARGALAFNMGNCSFRSGDLPRAVWHYREARRLIPDDESVRFNLALAERRLGVVQDDAVPLRSWLRTRLSNSWSLLLVLVVLEGLALFVVVGSRSRSARRWAAMTIFAVIAIGVVTAVISQSAPMREAVALVPTGVARAEPHRHAAPAFDFVAGEAMTVIEGSDQWLRVTRDGREGWVARADFGIVD